MSDLILTGASRGIGRALALALASRPGLRLILLARDEGRLAELARELGERGVEARVLAGDLASLADARRLGAALAELVRPGATLVHNAGIWPSSRSLTPEGLETAFVVNHLAPTLLQAPLLARRRLARLVSINAGLLAKGRFDPQRTPRGDDFSSFRTYCTTKLCFALSMHDLAAEHPELEVIALHPGVVRTELGAREGLLGALLRFAKRGWEDPETCAARLARLLATPVRPSEGRARWLVEESELPWPAAALDPEARRAVRAVTEALLGAAI